MFPLRRNQIGLILILSQMFLACQSQQPAPIGQKGPGVSPVASLAPHSVGSPNLTPTSTTVSERGSLLAIATGHLHSCVINVRGELFCFGDNQHGQLGVGNPVSQNLVHVSPGTLYRAVAPGIQNTCAITNEQALQCWGDRRYLGAENLGFFQLPISLV